MAIFAVTPVSEQDVPAPVARTSVAFVGAVQLFVATPSAPGATVPAVTQADVAVTLDWNVTVAPTPRHGDIAQSFDLVANTGNLNA
ncbi:MAG: hypothetical protein NT122_08660 [Solirubrobacterales bacterium]|nr:hypothetical protein [Solirubrobacterales bacterium]